MNAPTFIAVGTRNETTSGSIAPAYPGSIVLGDLLFLLAVSTDLGSHGAIATPAGWTALVTTATLRDSSPADVGVMALFFKVAAGTESGSQTVTRTGTTGPGTAFAGQIYQFRGREYDSNEQTNQQNSAATITWNAVFFSGARRTLLAFVGQADNTSAGTPAGYTNAAGGGTNVYVGLNYQEDVTSDGAVTASGGTTSGWCTVHLSIFNPSGYSQVIVSD